MYQRRIDRLGIDLDLLIARRRADACTLGSPSWDAAMGLVQELEDALRQIGETADPQLELLVRTESSN
jgi:hypothetical protein